MEKAKLRKRLELSLNNEISTDENGNEYIQISGDYQKLLDRLVDNILYAVLEKDDLTP